MSNYGQVYATNSIGYAEVERPRKKTMKKTFKQKIRDWLFDENNNAKLASSSLHIEKSSIDLTKENSIKFEIHHANGGRVIQTRKYDPRKDRHVESLYIITTDQDFGREIDKIITMEFLKT